MRPSLWPVWLVMLAAVAAQLLPWPDYLDPLRPPWVTLAVIYWALMWPGRFGVGSALLVGLLLDIGQGTLLGQHALTLCAVAYLVLRFHLQMRVFPVWQLTVSVFALVFLEAFLLMWIDGITGRIEYGADRWGPALVAAVLWPLLMALMDRLRERLERRDSRFA